MSLGRGKTLRTAPLLEFMPFCIGDCKKLLNEKILKMPCKPKLDAKPARPRLLNINFPFYLPWHQRCRRSGLGLVCFKISRKESGEL